MLRDFQQLAFYREDACGNVDFDRQKLDPLLLSEGVADEYPVVTAYNRCLPELRFVQSSSAQDDYGKSLLLCPDHDSKLKWITAVKRRLVECGEEATLDAALRGATVVASTAALLKFACCWFPGTRNKGWSFLVSKFNGVHFVTSDQPRGCCRGSRVERKQERLRRFLRYVERSHFVLGRCSDTVSAANTRYVTIRTMTQENLRVLYDADVDAVDASTGRCVEILLKSERPAPQEVNEQHHDYVFGGDAYLPIQWWVQAKLTGAESVYCGILSSDHEEKMIEVRRFDLHHLLHYGGGLQSGDACFGSVLQIIRFIQTKFPEDDPNKTFAVCMDLAGRLISWPLKTKRAVPAWFVEEFQE